MKREELLQAIGGVGEEMLREAEGTVRSTGRTWGRIALVAATVAVLAGTVAAATGMFSRPIGDTGIISGETIAPFDMDAEGNIIAGGVVGQKVSMEVEIDEDAPAFFEEIYYLKLPEDWKDAGGGGAGGGYEISYMRQDWQIDGKPGRLRLHQSVTGNYVAGVEGENCVDMLHGLPANVELTTQKVTMAGLEILKLTVPELPGYDETKGHHFCAGGESRLYWSDGRYLLQLDYPYWLTDAEAEEFLKTLYIKEFTPAYPDGYGTVDAEKIANMNPYLYIEKGNTGTTSANSSMSMGSFAYGDGKIYCSVPGAIVSYDLQTGDTQTMLLESEYHHPAHMFTTEYYVGYILSSNIMKVKPRDGGPESIVYQGVDSPRLYADGMTLYTTEGIIDLNTGDITDYGVDGIFSYVDDTYIYLLPGEDENYFLRSRKDTLAFEKIQLDFYPIAVVGDGEALYFCKGGVGNYNLFRWCDGEVTELPMQSYFYQVLDGHVLYLAEENTVLKSYDLESGETAVVKENVFDFSVLEGRYVCMDMYNADAVILDWQTGETVTVDTYE